MEKSFKNLINQSKSTLVLLSQRPNFDEIASSVALYLTLKKTHNIVVSCPTPMTVEFNRIIGVNKIVTELGNKNMLISFADYRASDIERVSYDIEDGKFKLTIIPKPGINAPQKDQVALTYSGISADTIIMVGGKSEKDFTSINTVELKGLKLYHVGIQSLQTSLLKDLISFDRPASSVSELVSYLLKDSGLEVDADSATNLLMGIEASTDIFAMANVTAETFDITSYLLRAGAKRLANMGVQPGAYPPGAVPQAPYGQPQQYGQVQQSYAPSGYSQQPASFQQYVQPQQPVQQTSQAGVPAQEEQIVQDQIENKPIQQTSQTSFTDLDQPAQESVEVEKAPQDWLKPKIFKSSSVS